MASSRFKRGSHSAGLSENLRMSSSLKTLVTVLVLVVLAALIIMFGPWRNQTQGGDAPTPTPEPEFSFTFTPDMVADIPNAETPTFFSLSSLQPPTTSLDALQQATDAAREYGAIGYIMIDLDTGIGISYQTDYAPYGASTIKGMYAAYVCEDVIDAGRATFDTPIEGYYLGVDFTSQYYSTTVGGLLSDMVLSSDNDAFGVLKQLYDDGWYDWTSRHGVSEISASFDDWFPFYSPRTGIKIWAHINDYLQSGSDGAAYLESLYGRTEVSFVRDGVSHYNAQVLNKAGWWVEPDPYWNCVSDNAIVRVGDHTYLVSIMSGLPDGGTAYERVAGVAAALYESFI